MEQKQWPKGHIGNIPVYCSFDEILSVEKVVPNPKNPNTHSQSQIELLAQIISKQGWRRAITISRRSGFIVVGEGRYLAALHSGMPSVPVDYQEYNSQDEEFADMVADNKLASMSDFDEDLLVALLSEMDESMLGLTSFDENSISELLDGLNAIEQVVTTNEEIDTGEYDQDKFDHVCPRCNFSFND